MNNNYKPYLLVATGFIIFLSMMLVLISLGHTGLDRNYKELDKIISVSTLKIDLAQEMRYLIRNEAVIVRNVIMDDVNRNEEIRRINETRKKYINAIDNLMLLLDTGKTNLLIEKIAKYEKTTRLLWDEVIRQAQLDNLKEGYRILVQEVRPVQWKWLDALDQLVEHEQKEAIKDHRTAYDVYISSKRNLTIVGIVTVLLGVVIASIIITGISRPLKAVIKERTVELEAANELLKNEISGRKKIEKNLRLSLKELRFIKQMVESIMHGITDEIFLITRDYKIAWANEAALKKYGYELNQIEGKFCYEVSHHKESHCNDLDDPCVFEELKSGVKSKTVEHVHTNNDGRKSLVEITVYPILDEDGALNRVVHVSRDITERVKMQEQILALYSATEQSPVGVVITDLTGKIEYVNHQFTKMTQYNSEEVLGKTLSILKSGKHPAEFYKELWHTILTGKVWQGSICNKKKGGGLYWESQSISPIKNQKGQITQFVAVKIDETERKLMEERLMHMANYDSQSDLPNRGLFYERLNEVLKMSKRYDHQAAVMFLDLDNFKSVNDVYGHDVGDLLLKEVAKRLRGCVRNSDTVARMGGDEFTIILSRISKPEDASLVADYIIEALTKPFVLAGNEFVMTTSIGISVFPSDSDDVEILIANADTAMYHVKNASKNKYQFYSALEQTST